MKPWGIPCQWPKEQTMQSWLAQDDKFVKSLSVIRNFNSTYGVNFPLKVRADTALLGSRNTPQSSLLVEVLKNILATLFKVSHSCKLLDRNSLLATLTIMIDLMLSIAPINFIEQVLPIESIRSRLLFGCQRQSVPWKFKIKFLVWWFWPHK